MFNLRAKKLKVGTDRDSLLSLCYDTRTMPRAADREESSSESESDESDGEPIILLQAGREKRYNAGNRMRDLLDLEEALVVEEDFKEELNDGEFVGKGN